MKAYIVIAALVASSHASLHGLHSGSSVSSRVEDGLGNYKFGYKENHATGGTFRSEAGNPHGVHGSYGLTDIDGRSRVVHYVADGHGFRASIKTNEPGTAPQPAAATSIAAPVAKVLTAHASHVAPVVVKAPLALGYGLGHGYGNVVAHHGHGWGHGGYGLGWGHGGYGHGWGNKWGHGW